MQEIVTFDQPTRFIMHFESEEVLPRFAYYQCEINPFFKGTFSPSGDFVRFNYKADEGEPTCEVHGWQRVDNIVIDEILEVQVDGEWRAVSSKGLPEPEQDGESVLRDRQEVVEPGGDVSNG